MFTHDARLLESNLMICAAHARGSTKHRGGGFLLITFQMNCGF